MRASIFLCIVSTLFGFALAFPYKEQLYEGSDCPLEDGTIGICKKLPECPSRIQEVKEGKRTSMSSGRCGFEDFVEIVCCPFNITEKIGLRPSEVACREYENEVTTESTNNPLERDIQFHIFGGVEAQTGEFPYMVALGYDKDDNDYEDTLPVRYLCGGTLISSQHVLTAAHCVNNIFDRVPKEVRVGHADLASNSNEAQRIEISDIIAHPRYKRSVNYNDVALLKLKKPVRVTSTVKPICLQTRPLSEIHPDANVSFVVIGWGATNFANDGTTKLMKTPRLNIIDTETCSKSYTGYSKLPRGLDDTMVCALDMTTNSTLRADACQGDSGGPLLMLTQQGHTVVGITAFGQACGTKVPGVYTSVYSFLDWIEEHVWPEQSEERDTNSDFKFRFTIRSG